MTHSVGQQLPEELRPVFDGTDLGSKEGITFMLTTAAADGWPHMALLSVGEVLATEPGAMRFALWPASTSTANLTLSGKGLLALVYNGTAYYLRCVAERKEDLRPPDGHLAFFAVRLEDVLVDVVTYAVMESGLSFRLNDRDKVLARWQRTVDAMRAAPV